MLGEEIEEQEEVFLEVGFRLKPTYQQDKEDRQEDKEEVNTEVSQEGEQCEGEEYTTAIERYLTTMRTYWMI